MEGLQDVKIVVRVPLVAEKTFRVEFEGVCEVLLAVVCGPVVDCDDRLLMRGQILWVLVFYVPK